MSTGTPQRSALIVVWRQEPGGIGRDIVHSLKSRFGLELAAEIEPADFFSLEGVTIQNDIIQFPMSRLYACGGSGHFIFYSDAPETNHYEFLTRLLDLARNRFGITELYTAGTIVSAISHTSPRRVFGIVNRPDLREPMLQCGVHTGMDYETPPGGGTTVSNFLLWIAKTQELAGNSLWVETPFYLAGATDPAASRRMMEVLDAMLQLGVNLKPMDIRIAEINQKLYELRAHDREAARCLELLERGIMLSEEESRTLATAVMRFLLRR